jgi:hypothetical protein
MNPEKNSKLKKDTLKIITQHRELNDLEEEHRCMKIDKLSITGSFFLRNLVIPYRVLKVVIFILILIWRMYKRFKSLNNLINWNPSKNKMTTKITVVMFLIRVI